MAPLLPEESNLDCLGIREEGLESEPGMSLEWLLAPVPVIVEELLARADGLLGHEDEPGHLLDHHDLGDAVGAHAAVVQQPTVTTRLLCPVNAENVSSKTRYVYNDSTHLPILFSFMFKVIHVTTLAGVHWVLWFEILCSADVYQFPRIFHNKVPLIECLHSLEGNKLKYM